MSKDQEIDLSTSAASNTDFGGINVDEGMARSAVNNAMRQLAKMRASAITRHVAKAAGSYTPAKSDAHQFWRCTGAVTLNLTAAATLTDGWSLWVRANGGAVTIDPNGAETINGSATFVLADGQECLILCNGSAFFTEFTTGKLTGKGSDTASASTTDLSAIAGNYIHVTGTTTITALGAVESGRVVALEFDGALTFTHNATSLILPGAENITTAAGDMAIMVSEGSGNWRCLHYRRASFGPPRPPTFQEFTGSGTWTRPAGCKRAVFEGVGGGGGSGGVDGQGAATYAGSPGGGSGFYGLTGVIDVSGTTSASVTIGAAGTAGSAGANNGGNGGNTSITIGATTYTWGGGTGSAGITGSASGVVNSTAGGAGTNVNGASWPGEIAIWGSPSTVGQGGAGGSNPLGTGGASQRRSTNGAVAGNAGTGYGAGGGGAANHTNVTDAAGAAGTAGYMRVWEFY